MKYGDTTRNKRYSKEIFELFDEIKESNKEVLEAEKIFDGIETRNLSLKKKQWVRISALSKTLPPREVKILKMRFKYRMTYDEVAKYFDISRSRVKQLEARALENIQNNN